MGEAIQAIANNWGIRMVQSTPYNPQSNGQAEASTKVIKGILEMIDKNPKEWHSFLSNSLWAYRIVSLFSAGAADGRNFWSFFFWMRGVPPPSPEIGLGWNENRWMCCASNF
ncbi:unnamed protein product [Prunus armeniaca]